ncbi:hypothetical protein CVT26_012388, partial [Gymnopilus dilepis]
DLCPPTVLGVLPCLFPLSPFSRRPTPLTSHTEEPDYHRFRLDKTPVAVKNAKGNLLFFGLATNGPHCLDFSEQFCLWFRIITELVDTNLPPCLEQQVWLEHTQYLNSLAALRLIMKMRALDTVPDRPYHEEKTFHQTLDLLACVLGNSRR